MGRSAAATAAGRHDFDIVLRIFKGIGAGGVLFLVMVAPVRATMSWHWLNVNLQVLVINAWGWWLALAFMFDGLSVVHGSELPCRPARPLRRVTSPLVWAMAQGVKAVAQLYAETHGEPWRLAPPPPASSARVLPEVAETADTVVVLERPPSIVDAEAEHAASPPAESDNVCGTSRRIRVLGGFRLDGWRSRGADNAGRCWWMGGERLLALLALDRRGMSRDALVEALFPDRDADRAGALLRQAAHAARTLLQPAGTVHRRSDWYAIVGDHLSVDLWEFEDALRDVRAAPAGSAARTTALRAAAAAYSGDLLDSVTWAWCEASAVTAQRQELQTAAMVVLEELAQVCERGGDVVAAAAALDQVLRLQPTAEHVVRRMMQLHAQRGCYEAARLTFETLRSRLREDGLRPQPQTVELARRLLEEGQAGGLD